MGGVSLRPRWERIGWVCWDTAVDWVVVDFSMSSWLMIFSLSVGVLWLGVELVHVGSVACWIVVILTGHATSVEREQGFQYICIRY